MKKIFIYILFFQLAFLSCKKSEIEPLFTESANLRAANQIATYKKQLSDSQYGWKAVYYPHGAQDGGYSFYLKFDDKGNVSMFSDLDGFFASTPFNTTYQVKALQKPTLIFDSYSYLHELVNPDYNGGTGALADLELSYEAVTDSKISLKGVLNDTQMELTKLTKTENDALLRGDYANTLYDTGDYLNTGKFLSLSFGTGQVSDLSINLNTKILTAFYNVNGQFGSATSAFSFTTTGILLKDNLTVYGNTFKEMFWDAVKKVYYINVNGKRIDVIESNKLSTPFRLAMGNLFGIIYLDPTLAGQSTVYSQLYTTMKNNLATNSTVAPVRVLTNVYFEYIEPGVWYLTVEYTRGTDTFAGLLGYNVSVNAQGNYTFNYFGTNANSIVLASIKPLTDILERNTFSIDYDPTNGKNAIIKGVTNPSFSMKGSLL